MRLSKRLLRPAVFVAVSAAALAGAYVHDERASWAELAPTRALASLARAPEISAIDEQARELLGKERWDLKSIDEAVPPVESASAEKKDAELAALAEKVLAIGAKKPVEIGEGAFPAARLVTAFSVRARDLAARGSSREAARDAAAAIVLAGSIRDSGTITGVLLGTQVAKRTLALVARLEPSLDRGELARAARFAWPSSLEALERTRAKRAQIAVDWVVEPGADAWVPKLVRENLAERFLARWDADLARVTTALASGAACPRVADEAERDMAAEAMVVCPRLAEMRAIDRSFASFAARESL